MLFLVITAYVFSNAYAQLLIITPIVSLRIWPLVGSGASVQDNIRRNWWNTNWSCANRQYAHHLVPFEALSSMGILCITAQKWHIKSLAPAWCTERPGMLYFKPKGEVPRWKKCTFLREIRACFGEHSWHHIQPQKFTPPASGKNDVSAKNNNAGGRQWSHRKGYNTLQVAK